MWAAAGRAREDGGQLDVWDDRGRGGRLRGRWPRCGDRSQDCRGHEGPGGGRHGAAVHHAWGTDIPAETADETQELVDRYVAQLAAAGVPATGEVHQELDSGIGDALIEVAMSHQAGLIVVGTRGRSNVKSMLLGSVAHEVVCKSTLPVLVVPDKTG
jgi:Universal stress protein family